MQNTLTGSLEFTQYVLWFSWSGLVAPDLLCSVFGSCRLEWPQESCYWSHQQSHRLNSPVYLASALQRCCLKLRSQERLPEPGSLELSRMGNTVWIKPALHISQGSSTGHKHQPERHRAGAHRRAFKMVLRDTENATIRELQIPYANVSRVSSLTSRPLILGLFSSGNKT